MRRHETPEIEAECVNDLKLSRKKRSVVGCQRVKNPGLEDEYTMMRIVLLKAKG